MLTLTSERFAPTTSTVGFFRRPLGEVADGLVQWRERLHGSVSVAAVSGSLKDMLVRLQPLTLAIRPRELLIQTANPEWTAYFDCFATGTDADPTLSVLSEALHCEAVYAESIPHTMSGRRSGSYGSVQFRLYGPEPLPGNVLNYVRTIAAVMDGDRWVFEASGPVQTFERPEAYEQRRIRKRFTSIMLDEYCAELGIRLFDEAFYHGPGMLVESPLSLTPSTRMALGKPAEYSYSENRHRLGIMPGEAEHIIE